MLFAGSEQSRVQWTKQAHSNHASSPTTTGSRGRIQDDSRQQQGERCRSRQRNYCLNLNSHSDWKDGISRRDLQAKIIVTLYSVCGTLRLLMTIVGSHGESNHSTNHWICVVPRNLFGRSVREMARLNVWFAWYPRITHESQRQQYTENIRSSWYT